MCDVVYVINTVYPFPVQVQTSLEDALEEQRQELLQDQQRWVNTAKDKLSWCTDVTGDKYSVEAKLATIKVIPHNPM